MEENLIGRIRPPPLPGLDKVEPFAGKRFYEAKHKYIQDIFVKFSLVLRLELGDLQLRILFLAMVGTSDR